MQECPTCGLANPDVASRCECGTRLGGQGRRRPEQHTALEIYSVVCRVNAFATLIAGAVAAPLLALQQLNAGQSWLAALELAGGLLGTALVSLTWLAVGQAVRLLLGMRAEVTAMLLETRAR